VVFCLVELRGRLSNQAVRQIVQTLTNCEGDTETGEQAATRGARHAPAPVKVRLGDAVVAQLVAAFVAGTTRQQLVDRYGVSLSSVKRLIRDSGALRSAGRAADP
jgi:hypothetical protein